MSTPSWYFDLQRQVSDLMNQTLRPLLHSQPAEEQHLIHSLIQKKLEKRTNMRPFLFYIGVCLGRGVYKEPNHLSLQDQELISKFSTVLELENISSYYINHFLDNKSDIQNELDAKNRVLAGLLCHNLAQQLIFSMKEFSIEERMMSLNIIESINHRINQAQVVDLNILTFKNNPLFKTQESFEKTYFERCLNISGQFYGRCVELGMRLCRASYDSGILNQISDLYMRMSTLGQFGNDIGDFAPPEKHSGTLEKNYYKDYGSDFLNGRLTYPNFMLLTRADKKELVTLEKIRRERFTRENIMTFISIVEKYKIIDDCLSILNNRWKLERKKLKLPSGELRTLVSSSLIIFKSNKLIVAARSLR